MGRQSFKERNRRRREQSAFETLYAYAQAHGVKEPRRAAERTAQRLHAEGADAGEDARRDARLAASATRDDGRDVTRGMAATRGSGDSRAASDADERSDAREEPADEGEAERVPHRLEDRTREQLYDRARDLDIAGRSRMTRDELVDAIRERN
jgi:hypothetical protein